MKVKIEDYRGFEINFDIDDEVFYCMSSSFDTEATKKSYSALKKWVDNYIKANQEFKPFKLVRLSKWHTKEESITISGCRKDGRFTYLDKDGKLQQLSEYDEGNWFFPKEENEPILKEIARLNAEYKVIEKQLAEFEDKLLKENFKSVRNNYLPV